MPQAEAYLVAMLIICALLAPYSMGWLADVICSRFRGGPTGHHSLASGSLDSCSAGYIRARVNFERAYA